MPVWLLLFDSAISRCVTVVRGHGDAISAPTFAGAI